MIQRWAVRILQHVIRRAPAARQEWGRAMLREMNYVEGDWAALRWAIGSAWSIRPAGVGPVRSGRWGTRNSRVDHGDSAADAEWICGLLAGDRGFVWYLFLFRSWMQQLGSGLTMAGATFMIYQLYRARGKNLPDGLSAPASVDFYRVELERQRDFHSGMQFLWRFLALIPGYVLCGWGDCRTGCDRRVGMGDRAVLCFSAAGDSAKSEDRAEVSAAD